MKREITSSHVPTSTSNLFVFGWKQSLTSLTTKFQEQIRFLVTVCRSPHFGRLLSEKGHICGFWACWEHARNGAKFGMLMYLYTFRTLWILVKACWFCSIWWHSTIKQVKFGVTGDFLERAWKKDLKFGMLMYPDHLQYWLHLFTVCWFCLLGW